MGTIEYIDNNFNKKFNIIFEILENLPDIPKKEFTNEIKKIKEKYDIISITILHEYYTNDLANKEALIEDYHKSVLKNSIHDDIEFLINNIKNHCLKKNKNKIKDNDKNKNKKNDENKNNNSALKFNQLIKSYSKIPSYKQELLNNDNNYNKNKICVTCQGNTFINNAASETICSQCGELQPIVGTVFENVQLIYQDGTCSKHASYERIKHGEKWLAKIQAKENIEIKKEVINAVKRQIRLKQITDVRKVTYDLIRDCLRKSGNTKYNENIVFIKYKITGIQPPQLTEKEYNDALYYLDKVVVIFEKKKPKYRHNLPYHAFFIFKILEQPIILKEDTPEDIDRKKGILSNIHIQSENTVRKRDILWRLICDEIPEFIYIPTDRNKYKIRL